MVKLYWNGSWTNRNGGLSLAQTKSKSEPLEDGNDISGPMTTGKLLAQPVVSFFNMSLVFNSYNKKS
jgi:hypothetical protein